MIILSMPLSGPAIPFPALRLSPGVATLFHTRAPDVTRCHWCLTAPPQDILISKYFGGASLL
jgi:hypothetical protein